MENTDPDDQTDSGVDTEGVETEGVDFSGHPMTQSRLFKAIQEVGSDTLRQVKELISEGEEDVSLQGVYEETYLHLLCTPTSKHQARYLTPLIYVFVGAGVDVNAQDSEGNTVLHVCAINESPASLLKTFLRAGADPTITNTFENTPMDFADAPSHKAMLERYDPGLYKAVELGDMDKVQLMAEHWFNLSIKPKGAKLSKVAKKAGHSSLSEWISGYKKQSSLIHAVLCGDRDATQGILDSKEDVDVDIMDRSCVRADGTQRMWPLVAEALYTGVSTTIATLLLKKVDVNQTIELETGELQPLYVWALHTVTAPPDSHFLKALLKHADIALYKADQYLDLYHFWKQGFPATILECFVSHGYDLMTRDEEGNTLRDRILLESYTLPPTECKQQLMFVDKCLLRLVKDGATDKLFGYLLKGCDLNITDQKGSTALEIAKKAKQSEVVELLEQASTTAKTIKTLYKAIELGNLQGLRGQLNARLVESRDSSGRTLLHTAVMFERTFIIQYLLKCHQEILHHTDMHGRSALHYACWSHLADIEEKLLAAGLDPHLKDKVGKTALDYKLDNRQEAEQERYQRYGVKAQLLNAYFRACDVITSQPTDNVSMVETQLGGLGVNDLDDLQELCPDLPYRKLLFLCVEHKKENTARGLVMSGADIDVTEEVSDSAETSKVVTFLQAAAAAGLQGLVTYCKKKMSNTQKNLHWERAAQLNLSHIGLDSRMTLATSRGSTALSRHSWDSVMSPPRVRDKAGGGGVGQRSASVDTMPQKHRYGEEPEQNRSSSCVIL